VQQETGTISKTSYRQPGYVNHASADEDQGDFPSFRNSGNDRRPLRQAPLGASSGSWTETNRKNQKARKAAAATAAAANSDRNEDDGDVNTGDSARSGRRTTDGAQNGEDPFTVAVRMAERSVVVYNLNLGQAPLLNPNTISSRITTALLAAAAANIPGNGSNTSQAGEMVNDLLSQVRSMDLLGKGTKPCKDPKRPANNGTFYTIPVKLSFNNKQIAKNVTEMLRTQYKVSTSIPYHRTLKKAMTLAYEKVSKANPGKHVLITLDSQNRCLKALLKTPPGQSESWAESGWEVSGNGPILLPYEALNPRIREIPDDYTLPTTPTLLQSGKEKSVSTPSVSAPNNTNSAGTGALSAKSQGGKETSEINNDIMEVVASTETQNGGAAGFLPAV